MRSFRSRPCFSTVPSLIQESWISASLNFEFLPQLGGEDTSPIKITQCSSFSNNGCVMLSSQKLPLVERIFPLESSFPPAVAFESFGLFLSNHYSPQRSLPCFLYAASLLSTVILLRVLTCVLAAKHIPFLPSLCQLWLRSPRSCLSPPLTVRAFNSNVMTVFL